MISTSRFLATVSELKRVRAWSRGLTWAWAVRLWWIGLFVEYAHQYADLASPWGGTSLPAFTCGVRQAVPMTL